MRNPPLGPTGKQLVTPTYLLSEAERHMYAATVLLRQLEASRKEAGETDFSSQLFEFSRRLDELIFHLRTARTLRADRAEEATRS